MLTFSHQTCFSTFRLCCIFPLIPFTNVFSCFYLSFILSKKLSSEIQSIVSGWNNSPFDQKLLFLFLYCLFIGIFPPIDCCGTSIMKQLVFVFNFNEISFFSEIVVKQLKMLNIIMCDSWTLIFTIWTKQLITICNLKCSLCILLSDTPNVCRNDLHF